MDEQQRGDYWICLFECIDHGLRGDAAGCREWAEKFLASLEDAGDSKNASILNGILLNPVPREEVAWRADPEKFAREAQLIKTYWKMSREGKKR
jgi:hypothetical protein